MKTNKDTNFVPKNNVESLLAISPKDCSCGACNTLHESAKKELGKSRYKTVCTQLGAHCR